MLSNITNESSNYKNMGRPTRTRNTTEFTEHSECEKVKVTTSKYNFNIHKEKERIKK